MTKYSLYEWATQPFSRTWTHIVAGDLVNPQSSSSAALDLLCYDRNAGVGGLFATVKSGILDDNTPVENGAFQIEYPINFDHQWDQIVMGEFGKSGAQVFFYDASTGTGAFYRFDKLLGLTLVRQISGFRTTWTHIVAGHFSNDEGRQILFYDAGAGAGEIYAVDATANIHMVGSTNTGWRNTWYTIVTGKFSDSKYDDLLFYDKGAGTGEFYHTDGHGRVSPQFNSHTDWRTTWRSIRAGNFNYDNDKYSSLMFYEDSTGYTEFYGTDGYGGIGGLNVNLGNLWPAEAAGYAAVLTGNFIGATIGGLSDIVAYHPDPLPPRRLGEIRRATNSTAAAPGLPERPGSLSYFQFSPTVVQARVMKEKLEPAHAEANS